MRSRCSGSRAGAALGGLLAAALVLGGCGGTPPAGDNRGAAGREAAVPPQVLTDFERAAAAMAAGEAEEAEVRFRDFLARHPGYPGVHVNLAILAAGRGDDAAAEHHVAAALALDPASAPALNQLGMLRRRQGRFEEAEAAYLKAVTAAPEYPLAHYNLGVLNELYLQRLERALRSYERYLELGGSDERVDRWIADLKRRIGAAESTADARGAR